MPVFNESLRIGKVLEDWCGDSDRLGINYSVLIYDAGSEDGTLDVIGEMSRRRPGRIMTSTLPGLPHGPSVVKGYREAAAEWVFQCDSDDAIGVEPFGDLWARRNDFDLLIGRRHGRRTGLLRRFVTLVSRWCVNSLFGSPVADANCPYRLLRGSALADLLRDIPDDAVAPNVILSGLAGLRRLRVYQVDVIDRGEPVGTAGLASFKLGRHAFLAFRQTMKARFRPVRATA